MTMDISTLLSGAGNVARGSREQEARLRQARQEQLALEALNRQEKARRIANTAPLPVEDPFGPPSQRQDVGVRAPTYTPPAAQAPGVAVPPAKNPTTTLGKTTAPAPAPEKPQMTQAEFLALPPEKRAKYLQIENDKRKLNQVAAGAYYGLSGAYDVGAAPINAAAWALEKGANAVGWPRLGRAVGLYGPDTGDVTVPRIGDGSLTPMANDELRKIAANKPMTEEDYINTLPATNSKGRRGGSYAARKQNAAGVATPGTSQYDKPTQFDPLIQQAAIDKGVDPVVFKRLLGSESSFDPTAESPRGKDYGLGIGQISKDHGLSDEQRLDPNVAIPKAAEILASYVDAAGGDYREALMKYKGASSEKGRAAMAPVIDSILGGLQPTATLAANDGPVLREAVAAGGQRQSAAPAAAAQPTSPSQFYLANPEAINRDMRVARQQRDELVRMAQMYQQSGMGMEYQQVRQAIMAHDQQIANLAGIQAVQEMEFANDPSRLSQMLSYVQGQQIDLKPFTDGTFDIYVNGRLAHKNVDGGIIKDQALSLFDPAYRAQKAEQAKEAFKGAIADRSEIVKTTADMISKLKLEQFKGDVQMQVEYLKKTTGWDVKPDTNTGLVYILPPGERVPLVWSPEGRTIERDGEQITINSAQPIAGLR